MIRESFIFLEGVGSLREKKLWQQGINHWDHFLEQPVQGIAQKTKVKHAFQIKQAERALQDYDFSFFHTTLPKNQHWRLFQQIKDNVVYLDIETSGYYGDITVLGMYDGQQTMTMVKGKNMDKELFNKTLQNYDGIATFNGSSFDLPIITRYFGTNFNNHVHIDLRHVCSKIGLRGGLKNIEKEIGLKRAEEVAGVTGEDAVYLWQQYQATGNAKYLQLLVQYNEEDIVNLEPLAKKVIPQVWKAIHF
ncbi:ribonuclease H-like domain-containing protein [Candidatus Woesearchaeota archaeon]|nr:ribonuclease H-like domain-containing protein [Candidatus Woesearchaeota archaeon]